VIQNNVAWSTAGDGGAFATGSDRDPEQHYLEVYCRGRWCSRYRDRMGIQSNVARRSTAEDGGSVVTGSDGDPEQLEVYCRGRWCYRIGPGA
jgi:hypothetical protein